MSNRNYTIEQIKKELEENKKGIEEEYKKTQPYLVELENAEEECNGARKKLEEIK